jgi:glycosyltransferase involved in cell wall biosynthesis
MKVAYIVEGLYNSGGMERVITKKANWFAENGIDVSVITYNQGSRPYFYSLINSVHKVDLKLNINLCNSAFRIRKVLKSKLEDVLYREKFDICISTYGQEFFILYNIKDGSKKIVEFHFAFDVNEKWIMQGRSTLKNKMIGRLYTWRMVYYANKYDRIVVLTKADEMKWEKYIKEISQIYNPLTIDTEKKAKCEDKIAIAVGRMDFQKGFDYLIEAWKIVAEKHPDWILHIFGGGDDSVYKNMVERLNLSETIKFMGVSTNLMESYLESSFYILSSRYEGFPLAIMEAMRCGLPVVSFDCPSGPQELIRNGVNGFLVSPVGNINELADRICDLIENEKKRKEMGIASGSLSNAFTDDCIMKNWTTLFSSLLN